MRFNPKTPEELAALNNAPPGVYPFEITTALDTQSKSSGADMIKLTVRFFVADKTRQVNDYLLESMPAKLAHFCRETGLTGAYEAGTLCAADCIGKTGFVKIGLSKERPRDDGGVFDAKNEVKDYVPAPINATARPEPTADQLANIEPSKAGDNERAPWEE